jgi:hypothetical protein
MQRVKTGRSIFLWHAEYSTCGGLCAALGSESVKKLFMHFLESVMADYVDFMLYYWICAFLGFIDLNFLSYINFSQVAWICCCVVMLLSYQ